MPLENEMAAVSPMVRFKVDSIGGDAVGRVIIGGTGSNEVQIGNIDHNLAMILVGTFQQMADELFELSCPYRLVMTQTELEEAVEADKGQQHIKPFKGWHPGGRALCGSQPPEDQEWASVVPQTADFIFYTAPEKPEIFCLSCLVEFMNSSPPITQNI